MAASIAILNTASITSVSMETKEQALVRECKDLRSLQCKEKDKK